MEDTRVSMAEILRLRKLRKQRAGGVEFSSTAISSSIQPSISQALVPASNSAPVEAPERFARQTGMVGDVDKHM